MKPLRVLAVAPSDEDVALIVDALRPGGWDVTARLVDDEPTLHLALATERWDLVVADYGTVAISALATVRTVQASGLDLPIVVLAGSTAEDVAVEVLKAGAHDFLLKDRLARFVPAVERELREAEVRRERSGAAAALRHSEQKYRRIVETSQEGIWQVDASGHTTFVNHRMAEMLGTVPSELLGTPFDAMVAPSDRPLLAELAELGGATEIELRRPDGRTFWGSVSLTPLGEDQGRSLGMLAMVADVTEKRKMQAQLMVSDRMASVGMLAAGVAHEINNPLTAVLGNLELATRALADPERDAIGVLAELGELLRDAREAGERVRQIVRDLKLFSRAEEDTRAAIDVHRTLESTLRMAANEVRHRARLVRDFDRVPPVLANESRLGQVFLNLVVNAAQAIPEGHAEQNTIEVATRTDPLGNVVICVRDTGPGMTEEVLRNLFTPFFTTKPQGVGTGLGLSICHRIVTSIGGQISAESRPGGGSTFRVVLPPARAAARPTPRGSPTPTGPALRRARILVVDDEAQIGAVLARMLEEHDVTVVREASVALARLVAGEEFDTVLCDLMMPDLSGMELYERVAAVRPDIAGRFVFITGGAFTPRARAFLDRVPNARIDKPFDAANMRSLVLQRG